MNVESSKVPVTIPAQPVLTPAADFYALRREGIEFIEQMSSAAWTDYNAHDPGITILEQLCYLLTELAYRHGWDIKDLLMSATPAADPAHPYPYQSFFTAREILTVNPVTPDDYRRLLIGLGPVRNAWVFCKQCACDVVYYSYCELNQQIYSYASPPKTATAQQRIDVRGLYEVLLELEADPESGDLNDAKVELEASVNGADGKPHELLLELRFPNWELAHPVDWQAFMEPGAAVGVKLLSIGATRTYDVMSDPVLDDAGRDRYLRQHWNGVFYLAFEVELAGALKVAIRGVALHLFGDNPTRAATTVAALRILLQAPGSGGAIPRYREKARKTWQAVDHSRDTLAASRNLDEDWCRIGTVKIEDVAVCADIEVAPGADIELVQAQAWFRIEQYFNPPVRHYSLREMLDSGVPVEEIFNGPMPEGGFLKQDELAASGLKTVLRNSDLINLLMDIEGVVAIGSLLMSKYDAEGELVKGAADPTITGGALLFDPAKGSAAWQLYMSPLHQPRLYFRRSRFLFMKNGLPFRPRMDEAADTLTQLQGEAERGKIKNAPLDLAVPSGTFRRPNSYHPLQYGFPDTYGIGPAGLSANASSLRKAQARQLQAYLMVFEQLLANAGEQLSHVADLFSLDPKQTRSYFARELDATVIAAYGDVVQGLTPAKLNAMTETQTEFQQRRNRFLDHLLARFGENFAEYALLLTNARGVQTGMQRLIDDKIGFLDGYPRISRDRGRAFDYSRQPCAPENVAGIKLRVSLLLGYPELAFAWTMSALGSVGGYALRDRHERVWLEGTFAAPITASDDDAARQLAYDTVIARLSQPEAYHLVGQGGKFRLKVRDKDGAAMGAGAEAYDTLAAVRELMEELLSWSANYRGIVVEHLLLRPKFPGDALIAPCSDAGCTACDDADPYSFRLSFVMPGWTAPFNDNLDLRGFADRTIQQELPSHLLAKVCWVVNDGFIVNPCEPVVGDVAELLQAEGLTNDGKRSGGVAACACAEALYEGFSAIFNSWYADKTLWYWQPDALESALVNAFASKPEASDFACTTVLEEALFAKVKNLMLAHFKEVVLNGWQFERFENAWCAWLQANAPFDWTTERVQARVQAILAEGLEGPVEGGEAALCRCAAGIVLPWGLAFDAWIEANMIAGRAPAEFTAFTPQPVQPCPGMTFKADTASRVEDLLRARYAAYTEVSYRLRIVLALLAKLRNTYPGATLHDCDDGSDLNPVRLGSTALGRQPRRTATAQPEVEIEPAPAPVPVPVPAPAPTELAAPAENPLRKRAKASKPKK
ncbi:hypothetical protein NHH73_16555 [Oxalobacteraceae bacterium OTU3CINTB1]|nr:hypothetical protein NHH73_16555 [Oxalobacteraceae bacterium OTU3CINTB1]